MSEILFLGLALLATAMLQRYAVAYGFEGKSKQDAWQSAKWCGVGLTVFVLLPLWLLA